MLIKHIPGYRIQYSQPSAKNTHSQLLGLYFRVSVTGSLVGEEGIIEWLVVATAYVHYSVIDSRFQLLFRR